jgi:hypothetical protein
MCYRTRCSSPARTLCAVNAPSFCTAAVAASTSSRARCAVSEPARSTTVAHASGPYWTTRRCRCFFCGTEPPSALSDPQPFWLVYGAHPTCPALHDSKQALADMFFSVLGYYNCSRSILLVDYSTVLITTKRLQDNHKEEVKVAIHHPPHPPFNNAIPSPLPRLNIKTEVYRGASSQFCSDGTFLCGKF